MRISDSKFHKVWKKEVQNGFIKLNLGDSHKKKDGTYDNCTWWGCALVGDAKNTPVSEGDVITINSGEMFKNKVGDKEYTNITIFSFEVTKSAEAKSNLESEYGNFEQVDDVEMDDFIPF